MLKGQDVVVLLKLAGSSEPVPLRDLAEDLGFDVAGTHRAMRRLADAGLYSSRRQKVHMAHAEEFLIHAVRFSFPPRWESQVRGVPTSWATEPLKRELADISDLPPVWPYAVGKVRGLGLEPLHPIVPAAALADHDLWEKLALVDALRSNSGTRITKLAKSLLGERLNP